MTDFDFAAAEREYFDRIGFEEDRDKSDDEYWDEYFRRIEEDNEYWLKTFESIKESFIKI